MLANVNFVGMLAPRLQAAVLPMAAAAARVLGARHAHLAFPSTATQHSKAQSHAHPFLGVPDEEALPTMQLPGSTQRGGIVLQGLGLDQHLHPQLHHPLVEYRASYPEVVWSTVSEATRRSDRALPVAIDIGVGTGRGAVELARRGYRVVGVEATPSLLARTHQTAALSGVALNLISARMEQELLPPGCADLVSVMHGLHLVDTGPALREAHRLLREKGVLVAAWNDRDLSSPFNQELEDLLEAYNPDYNRHSKQRSPDHWGPTLTQDGLFRLEGYSVHANPLPLKSAAPLLDIVDCQSCVRRARHSSAARRELHRAVVDLAHRHHGHGSFVLPLETKLYLLRRNDIEGLEYRPSTNASGVRPMFE